MAIPLKAPQAAPTGPQARRLKKGQLVFAEGENSRAMYLLKSGMIRIFKKKGDASIEIDTVHSGQVLGELAFLDGNPRSASGEALTDCELIEISGPTFQQTLGNMPDWLKILLKTVVGRLRTASTRIRQLETASTAVDYSDKSGKRSTNYVYLSATDVLKLFSGVLLVASRNGKPAEGGGIELRIGLLQRYCNQVMGVPAAKITTILDVLTQGGIIVENLDPSNPQTIVKDIDFLEQAIQYFIEENLAEPSKRHDITPRAFVMMGQILKHLSSFEKNSSGMTRVNLAKIYDGSEKKDALRLDDFQTLVRLGYATNPDMKSAIEIITFVNAEEFAKAYRFQRLAMTILAVNEQKRGK